MEVNEEIENRTGESEYRVGDTEQSWVTTISGGRGPDLFDGVIPPTWSIRQALMSPLPSDAKKALTKLLLAPQSKGDGASQRELSSLGPAYHPFNFLAAQAMESLSPHHASCLATLVDMTVGLGLLDEELYDTLNPLTPDGFDSLMRQLVTDVLGLGTGYIEVVRDPGSRQITGLHWLPGRDTYKVLDGRLSGQYHFMYTQTGMRVAPSGSSFEFDFGGYMDQAMFANFADVDRLASAQGTERMIDAEVLRMRRSRNMDRAIPFVDFGEAIQIKLPTNHWDHYGRPTWLGAQSYLDLSCAHIQRAADYMRNRGTPDHLLVMLGVNLTTEAKASLQACMSAGKGRNFGRSAAITIPGASNVSKVQLEKFSDGVDGLGFRELHDATALAICSAWRVPPILAGISVPRPMGSANELVQALVLTQTTVVEGIQRLVSTALGCTLGARGQGIPGFKKDSFLFKNLVQHTDIAALDTLARQKDTNTLGRSPKDGLKR